MASSEFEGTCYKLRSQHVFVGLVTFDTRNVIDSTCSVNFGVNEETNLQLGNRTLDPELPKSTIAPPFHNNLNPRCKVVLVIVNDRGCMNSLCPFWESHVTHFAIQGLLWSGGKWVRGI